jgi:hypothetical protein
LKLVSGTDTSALGSGSAFIKIWILVFLVNISVADQA